MMKRDPFRQDRGIAALIDIDGTLVDSTYLHATAWSGALRDVGFEIPTARTHRLIGMQGDRLLRELLGERDASRVADAAKAAHDRRFARVREQVPPLPHARELLEALVTSHMPAVLVSSAEEDEVAYYVEMLDAADLVSATTSAQDGSASKPDPEPIMIALDRSGCDTGVVIGDSSWDCLAAVAAGLPAVAVLTGGFSRAELEQAGAADVYEDLGELIADADRLAKFTAKASRYPESVGRLP